jgi:SAM-dependent methyltransferase
MDESDWERMWAPYDEATYQAVLDRIQPEDCVLDLGAGDLRLTRRIAALARKVYAIEMQASLLERAVIEYGCLPENLIVMQGDACKLDFPGDITAAVLLMRHCTHFLFYANKLRAAGCRRLITNARWRLGVEELSLQLSRLSYNNLTFGWFACWCGNAGFKPGPAEILTPETLSTIHEVIGCPAC